MANISNAIFVRDETDYDRLILAKKGELQSTGMTNPSDSAAKKAITREELARHCRRRTRGVEETRRLIEELLPSLSSATDTLGVPLLKEEMGEIWKEQRKHISCLQDPPGITLYTITGQLQKGGVTLPALRRARGSTSRESFHSHLVRFVPGTSANAVNFQAYLLEGITRWNTSRAQAALTSTPTLQLKTFHTRLQAKVCNSTYHTI